MGMKKIVDNRGSYIFTKMLDIEDLNTRMINRIDEIGDEAFHMTNVKANCTFFDLHHKYPEFKSLSDIVEDFSKKSSYKMQMDWENHHFRADSVEWYNSHIESQYCNLMWGTRYENEEITTPHDHWPAIWAFCYYIDPPEGCSNLIFPTLDYEIEIEHGLLVLFPGDMIHETVSKNFDGYRYCIAGTIRLQ
jgi:hypothetical protein